MQRSRVFATCTLLIATTVGLTACGASGSTGLGGSGGGGGATDTSSVKPTAFPAGSPMAAIQKRGKLIVGVKDDFPLFGMKNPVTGKLEGMDIQIADLLAKALTGSASNIQYVTVTSGNREAFLQQHKVDVVIATYPPNPERQKAVDFAGPYLMSPVSTMVRKGYTGINSQTDLNGKPICVTTGSGAETKVPKVAPKAKLLSLGSITECMQSLQQSRVDGVVTTNSILLGLMSQNPGKFEIAKGADLQIGGKTVTDNDSIGLPKGEKAFHDYLDSFLKQIEADGSWQKIYDSTVGTIAKDSPKPPAIMY